MVVILVMCGRVLLWNLKISPQIEKERERQGRTAHKHTHFYICILLLLTERLN